LTSFCRLIEIEESSFNSSRIPWKISNSNFLEIRRFNSSKISIPNWAGISKKFVSSKIFNVINGNPHLLKEMNI